MTLFMVAAAYLAALAFDFLPRISGSSKGEKALYLALMAAGLTLLVLYALDAPVPSPAKPIEQAVRAIFGVS